MISRNELINEMIKRGVNGDRLVELLTNEYKDIISDINNPNNSLGNSIKTNRENTLDLLSNTFKNKIRENMSPAERKLEDLHRNMWGENTVINDIKKSRKDRLRELAGIEPSYSSSSSSKTYSFRDGSLFNKNEDAYKAFFNKPKTETKNIETPKTETIEPIEETEIEKKPKNKSSDFVRRLFNFFGPNVAGRAKDIYKDLFKQEAPEQEAVFDYVPTEAIKENEKVVATDKGTEENNAPIKEEPTEAIKENEKVVATDKGTDGYKDLGRSLETIQGLKSDIGEKQTAANIAIAEKELNDRRFNRFTDSIKNLSDSYARGASNALSAANTAASLIDKPQKVSMNVGGKSPEDYFIRKRNYSYNGDEYEE